MKQIGISISDFHKIENRYPTAAEFTSFIDLPDIKTHVKGDWIYFPEIQMNSNTPLLISPIIMKDTIIVLRTDTSVQFFEESEVDQFLNSATTEPVEFKATLFQKK